MSATHTPGPWLAKEWNIHAKTTVVAGDQTVAECSGFGRHSDDSLADARLIAAAPDMLTALRLALTAIDSYQRMDGWQGETETTKAIRNAITKAEG